MLISQWLSLSLSLSLSVSLFVSIHTYIHTFICQPLSLSVCLPIYDRTGAEERGTDRQTDRQTGRQTGVRWDTHLLSISDTCPRTGSPHIDTRKVHWLDYGSETQPAPTYVRKVSILSLSNTMSLYSGSISRDIALASNKSGLRKRWYLSWTHCLKGVI